MLRWTKKNSWLKLNKCMGKLRRHTVVIERWNVVWIMAWTNTFMRWNGYILNMMWKGNMIWKHYNKFDEHKRSEWRLYWDELWNSW